MEIHSAIAARFSNWTLTYNVPRANDTCLESIARHFDRGPRHALPHIKSHVLPVHPSDLEELIGNGCYAHTQQGMVAQWDGELIFDNPTIHLTTKNFN